MKNKYLSLVESSRDDLPKFEIGDTVDVHVRILEGNKERVQVFNGTVIARRGEGVREMFTVRRIVQGEGVERIFPVVSPKIAKVEVKRTGRTRRAKLYYLRDRVGKATKLREGKARVDLTAAAASPNGNGAAAPAAPAAKKGGKKAKAEAAAE
jgi:large subunit ribosomal protein L19